VRFDWPFDNFESKVQSCRRKYSWIHNGYP
jgi:hypothetical protein